MSYLSMLPDWVLQILLAAANLAVLAALILGTRAVRPWFRQHPRK